jgi:uncharacterized linocin/CFP29 family protein
MLVLTHTDVPYCRVKEVKSEKERLHAELERKLNPKTKLDFAMLFNELDEWRRQEVAKIKVGICMNTPHLIFTAQ